MNKKIRNPIRQLADEIRNNNGSALLLAILILSGMMGATIVASSIIDTGIKMGKTQFDSTKAYFAAEAGAERLLWHTRKAVPLFSPESDSNCSLMSGSVHINFNPFVPNISPATCGGTPSYVQGNGSRYYAKMTSNDTVNKILDFKFYGIFGDVRRSVQVTYYY